MHCACSDVVIGIKTQLIWAHCQILCHIDITFLHLTFKNIRCQKHNTLYTKRIITVFTTFLIQLLNTTVSADDGVPDQEYSLNILTALWINWHVPFTVVIMAAA
jgi:hypothetical protein